MEPLYKFSLKDSKLHISTSNSKIGKIHNFSTLPGNKKNLIVAKGKLLTTVPGTCSKHCEGCFSGGCYAVNSIRQYHNTVTKPWAENTLLLRSGRLWSKLEEYFAHNKVEFFRINVSGEIQNSLELEKWNELALKHPTTKFGLYTKNFEALAKFIDKVGDSAPNFVINVSQWNGVADKFLSKYPKGKFNVFEYDGSNRKKELALMSEEQVRRLKKTLHCPGITKEGRHAVDKEGKPITCDRCKWCYTKTGKTVAVYSH